MIHARAYLDGSKDDQERTILIDSMDFRPFRISEDADIVTFLHGQRGSDSRIEMICTVSLESLS